MQPASAKPSRWPRSCCMTSASASRASASGGESSCGVGVCPLLGPQAPSGLARSRPPVPGAQHPPWTSYASLSLGPSSDQLTQQDVENDVAGFLGGPCTLGGDMRISDLS